MSCFTAFLPSTNMGRGPFIFSTMFISKVHTIRPFSNSIQGFLKAYSVSTAFHFSLRNFQFCRQPVSRKTVSDARKDMIHACSFTSFKVLKFGASVARNSLNYTAIPSRKCSFRPIRMEIDHNVRGDCNESRGALIVLEGLDRSGKSSQCGRLLSHLEGLGKSVELMRFPDRSTTVGKMISAYLSNESQLDDNTIHLLFSANRWERRSLMENKLKTGTTLIVDRYSYSGVAFSSAKGLDIEWCKAPEIGLLAPDLVLYLDIQPEKAAGRGGYGDERYEKLEFQKKVAQTYQLLRDSSWQIVDAGQSMEDVEKQLKKFVLDQVTACQKGKPLSKLWSH